MDALHASSLAECIEYELGAATDTARVECYAVPLKPGSTRRRSRWAFLVVSDLVERAIRETLACMDVEVVDRRGGRLVAIAWPRGASTDPYTAGRR